MKEMTHPLNKNQIDLYDNLINEIAEKQLNDFGHINSDKKPDGSLITECDRWSDKKIVEGINAISPGEGILSEEGNKQVPNTSAFWVVDPLDGTTNFAAGIPYWAISIARFVNGEPETAFLDIPALNKRFVAFKNKGVWLNKKRLTKESRFLSSTDCISLCSRSIRVLQLNPSQSFPGKIRLLGVSSLNMTSVALGQTIGALEATPKIWDIAAAWLILSELDCLIEWLNINPREIKPGEELSDRNFPLIAASEKKDLNAIIPWGNILMSTQQIPNK